MKDGHDDELAYPFSYVLAEEIESILESRADRLGEGRKNSQYADKKRAIEELVHLDRKLADGQKNNPEKLDTIRAMLGDSLTEGGLHNGIGAELEKLRGKVELSMDPDCINDIVSAVGLENFNIDRQLQTKIKELFKTELQAIYRQKIRRQLDRIQFDLNKLADEEQLIGLAFSGGGIRSATFNLGILQALGELELLRRFDYLSTVSGGGYIGAWLSAWVKRATDGIREVESKLKESVHPDDSDNEPRQIRRLRDYSNYLTPESSLFSGDTWTAISTYSRNAFLTLLLLVTLVSSILLMPRAIPYVSSFLVNWLGHFLWVGVLVAIVYAVHRIAHNLSTVSHRVKKIGKEPDNSAAVRWKIITPFMIGALLTTALIAGGLLSRDNRSLVFLVPLIYFFVCLLGGLFANSTGEGEVADQQKIQGYVKIASSIPAGLVGGAMLYGIVGWMYSWGEAEKAMWGPGLLVLLALIVISLHVGLIGRIKSEVLEWWLRLGGELSIVAFCWMGLFGVALYGPQLIDAIDNAWARSGLGVTWVISTIGGLLAGKSSSTGSGKTDLRMEWLAKLGPYIFVVGLFALLSTGLDRLFDGQWPVVKSRNCSFVTADNALCQFTHGPYFGYYINSGLIVGLTCLSALCLALVFSWRFDINLLSLHYFYRNRLIRCYLGASRGDSGDPQGPRRGQPFTGFDPNDNCKLSELSICQGPYHIVNAALNLVGGEELAWQQRKAASFVFTPKFCGYHVWNRDIDDPNLENEAYRRTGDYANQGEGENRRHGPSLGTAMAVSGAAVSPNMGYHSSPPVAFLLTVFSLRLGLWIGNPRHKKGWLREAPYFSLMPMLSELFGYSNERRYFCTLSDGGHFENLGLYELVRRRCRYIVVTDAGEDEQFKFEDLGNAIRKCRVDLHTEIAINVDALRPQTDSENPLKLSGRPVAIGEISYPNAAEKGILIYLKPVLTREVSTDVFNYARENSKFPHQSTGDQWFDESQFESYRKLGYDLGRSVFKDAADETKSGGALNSAWLVREINKKFPATGMTGRVGQG